MASRLLRHSRAAQNDESSGRASPLLPCMCSAPSAGAWGSVSDAHDVRRGIRAWWIWRRKWTILGSTGLLIYLFFRYGGVGPPPQDNDFVLTRGSEVSCTCTCKVNARCR